MKLAKLFLVAGFSVILAGCKTTILDAAFKDVSQGSFSNSSVEDYFPISNPVGDFIHGAYLEPETVRFAPSSFPEDGLALLLGPNPPSEANNPVLTFRPVQASSDHKKRTFYWQGEKTGYAELNCDFMNDTGNPVAERVLTLRFANGKAYAVYGTITLEIAVVPTAAPHTVWVSLKLYKVDVKINGQGLDGIAAGVYSLSDVSVICSYASSGSAISENYLFDKMVFSSR